MSWHCSSPLPTGGHCARGQPPEGGPSQILAVSVAGNVGHVAGHSLASRATAAVPPIAAAAALAVGLGGLKRVVEHHHSQPAPARVSPYQSG